MQSSTVPERDQTGAAEREVIPGSIELAVTQGLAPGSNLRENRVFRLRPTGVDFVGGEMTFEQWQHGMMVLRMAKTSLQVWLADFLVHGRTRFGEARVTAALVQMEFPQMEVTQALGIAGLPLALRNEKLTSEHYWVLAREQMPGSEKERWAGLAVTHEMSALRLQKSIAAGRVLTADEAGGGGSGGGGGLATIHGVRQLFDTWWHQVEAEDPLTKWSSDQQRALWEELRPQVEVGLKLARVLGIEVERGSEVLP